MGARSPGRTIVRVTSGAWGSRVGVPDAGAAPVGAGAVGGAEAWSV